MAPKKAAEPPPPVEDEEDEAIKEEEVLQGDFTFPDSSEYAGQYLKLYTEVGKVAVVRDEETNEAGFEVAMGAKFLVVANVDASRADLSLMRDGDILRLVNGQIAPGLDEYKAKTDEEKEFTVKLYREKVQLHGKGKMTCGPESFDGTFDQGSYADGTLLGIDGSKYTGGFRKGAFHGPGEYLWADGRSYKGMWQDGKMHGRGRFENFSFGVDRVFEGFCAGGVFRSGDEGQKEAKRSYLAEYGAAFGESATAALNSMAAAVKVPEVDPKAKKGGAEETGPAEIPKEFLVPAEGEEEDAAQRAAIEELAAGPFPEAAGLPTAVALQAFVALFTPTEEQPAVGQVTVYEESGQKGRFDGTRLKKQQLVYGGQAVEFFAPEAEPGAVSFMVFLNTSQKYDAAQASWRLVHTEDVPIPN